jgi:SAM-dependent methyltransferase
MGDVNQLHYIQRYATHLAGPYLEVGSLDYGSTQDLRSLFGSGGVYVGVDLREGAGVDVVLDLVGDFQTIHEKLGGLRFGTIFCLSVLEHCEQPFRMAENLTRLLKPGGVLCVSVPFAWKFHGYPNDYWRFTQEGVKKLFPILEFDLQEAITATSREGDCRPLGEDVGKIAFSSKFHRRTGHPLRGISAMFLKALARFGVWRWLCGYRYVLAPTNILMVGTLPLPDRAHMHQEEPPAERFM